jgi:hypothetical protein
MRQCGANYGNCPDMINAWLIGFALGKPYSTLLGQISRAIDVNERRFEHVHGQSGPSIPDLKANG